MKEFKIQNRRDGILGGVKDLFARTYENKRAVNDVSFDIEQGEVVGYIGPNGAGKSTTIKMLTGILKPTSGLVEVNGVVPYKSRQENAKNIGVVFGQRSQLWWDIPVKDTLALFKEMYNLPENVYKQNMEAFYDILGLEGFINMAVRQLSLGQRMRADLACAMIHNPKILFLDEPTIGLDVVVKEKIREFIKVINKEKETTILLTTHDMSDIEKLCSRVLVIDQGKIMYDGNLNSLKQKYQSNYFLTILCGNVPKALNRLETRGVDNIQFEGNKIRLSYDPRIINALQIIDILREENQITDFKLVEADIEGIIRKMYEHFPND